MKNEELEPFRELVLRWLGLAKEFDSMAAMDDSRASYQALAFRTCADDLRQLVKDVQEEQAKAVAFMKAVKRRESGNFRGGESY